MGLPYMQSGIIRASVPGSNSSPYAWRAGSTLSGLTQSSQEAKFAFALLHGGVFGQAGYSIAPTLKQSHREEYK